MEEIWKTVVINNEVYENYQVSNLGRLKSLGNNKNKKEKILSLTKSGGNYLQVTLCKEGRKEQCKVHRIVAEVFIPNTENLPCIDHINTIRTDNRVDNLRWCTQKENCNNELSKKKYSELSKNNIRSKTVICIETNQVFLSTREVERKLGIAHTSISAVCLGKCKTAGGFHWKYLEQ